jgi:hypothetical protein
MWTNEPCVPVVREFAFMDKLSTELQQEVQLLPLLLLLSLLPHLCVCVCVCNKRCSFLA